MSDKKLSELTAASSVAAEDLLYLVQGGVSKKLPASVLQQSSGGNMLFQRNLILTQAQILDLHNTPVEIITAVPGAQILPERIVGTLTGDAFIPGESTVSDGPISIGNSTIVDIRYLLLGATLSNDFGGGSIDNVGSAASVRNTGDAWTGPGSTVKLTLLYRLYNPTTNRFLTTSDGVVPDEPILSEAIVTITAAQLKDLVANPVELVPAPGVGKCIFPVEVFFDYKFGSVAFQNTGVSAIAVAPNPGVSNGIYNDGSFNFLLAAAGNAQAIVYFDAGTDVDCSNQPMVLYSDPTDLTDGDGTLTVHVLYRVVSLS